MDETTGIIYPAVNWSDFYTFSGRFCCPVCRYRPHPDTSLQTIVDHLKSHDLAFVKGVGLVRRREAAAMTSKPSLPNRDSKSGGLSVSRVTRRHGKAWYTLG